jgi:hypothetical protein
MSKTIDRDTTKTGKSGKKEGFAFGRLNYILLITGVLVIGIGYLLMIGGGSDDPNVFNEEELFSARRITLAPIVIVLGFITIVVAIMKKPKAS